MQIDATEGRRMRSPVPRRLGIILFAAALPLLIGAGPVEASTSPHSQVSTKGPTTLLPMTTYCYPFRPKDYISAFGYVHVGYLEIDVGACYDCSTTCRATIEWGPYCSSGWYVPFIRTSGLNYCNWYRDSTGHVYVYGSWTAQIWMPVLGWCCDRTFTYSYGL